MDARESLRDLLGEEPALWTLVLRTDRQPDRTWIVRLRLYYIEQNHAANVSPECSTVLHLPYDARCGIRVHVGIPGIAACACVRELSRRLYGRPDRIEQRTLA